MEDKGVRSGPLTRDSRKANPYAPTFNMGKWLSLTLRHRNPEPDTIPRDSGGWFEINQLMHVWAAKTGEHFGYGRPTYSSVLSGQMTAGNRPYWKELLNTVYYDGKGRFQLCADYN